MAEVHGTGHHVLLTIVVVVATVALGLAGMAFRPIETTVLLAVAGVVFAIVTARSRRGEVRRAGVAGIAIGCLAVLALYWTSALVNLEPDTVRDDSSSVADVSIARSQPSTCRSVSALTNSAADSSHLPL